MILRLPTPLSTNSLFKNARRGRVKTEAYENWIAEADIAYLLQRRFLSEQKVKGTWQAVIHLPREIRTDLDNCLKCPLDWLVSRELVEDDNPKYLQRIVVDIGTHDTNEMWITAVPMEGVS